MLESLIDRITRASLRFKWVTIILSIIVLVGGVFAVTQLKQELDEAVSSRQIQDLQNQINALETKSDFL